MNTNQLKRFAQEARVKLIDQIGAKLEKVLTTDSAVLREKAGHLKKLQEAINKTSKQEVIDTVAYTWFNRFVALRFMDVNGYEPLGISIVSPIEGGTLPAILQEAKQGSIPDELPVQHQHIYDVLDGKILSTDAQNEAYAALLVGASNHLNTVFPFLFEKIDDYAELLLPDDLISQFSILQDVREGMTSEDCTEVEIIGWLYQFYISEKKDEVFASKGKVKKEDIPAATQLFTPRWIVEYMVQNTVGKLWLQNNPQSKLREHMPYFIESPSITTDDYLKIESVEEITLLDQACGSGHILVYGFELLSKIYEEQGYNESEIPKLIIEKNLHGFEIDTRAAQLAGLALMLRARQYYRRVFKKDITPNILCYQDLKVSEEDIKTTFKAVDETLSDGLFYDLKTMQQATNYGSLIMPQTTLKELENTKISLGTKANSSDIFHTHNLSGILKAIVQLCALSRKHHCVIDNPPYMGDYNMNKSLSDFVKTTYPLSRYDMMVCFMERAFEQLIQGGHFAIINYQSWMFVSSFARFRKEFVNKYKINSMLHLGRGIFGSDFGTVSFCCSKSKDINSLGVYRRLFTNHSSVRYREEIENLFLDKKFGLHHFEQKNLNLIPNNNICYWFSDKVIENFKKKKIRDVSIAKAGIVSGNDSDFLRIWFEVSANNTDYHTENFKDISKEIDWYPINKGGNYRKYFGNKEHVINLTNLWMEDRTGVSVRRGDSDFYFKEAVTWTYVCGTGFSFRYSKNSTFATAAPALFINNSYDVMYVLALLNSKPLKEILPGINPTVNLGSGDVSRLPYIDTIYKTEIVKIVTENVEISKFEWNSRETAWNFKKNELVRINGQDIEEAYDSYCKYWQNKFFELHKNEEELNRQFIAIYGLQDELTPEVPLEDITILKEETIIKKGALVFRESEIMAQFISYAVGCMFGRYSLDKPGLVLANQGETLEDYVKRVALSEDNVQFLPDDDNVIPILDNEWFEDDIVNRFYAFLKARFGKQNFDKNLAFVEDAVGDIRKYFLKTFYADHVKRYKKRPIYWMFSSPSGAFNALIYMHRYTPDTLNTVLNGYLKEYQEKLKAQHEHLEYVKNVGTDREKVTAEKEQARINKVLLELQEYDRELFKIATERITIDLDDGVLVNYNKFGEVIKPVSGLNDKKAKDKVKKFDWIDVTEIR